MDWMWEGRERIWGLWLLEYLRMTSKLIALATREEGKLQMKWAVRMKISLLDLLFEISMTCKWKRSVDSWIYESWAQMRKAESQTFCLVSPGITWAHASLLQEEFPHLRSPFVPVNMSKMSAVGQLLLEAVQTTQTRDGLQVHVGYSSSNLFFL